MKPGWCRFRLPGSAVVRATVQRAIGQGENRLLLDRQSTDECRVRQTADLPGLPAIPTDEEPLPGAASVDRFLVHSQGQDSQPVRQTVGG